MKKSIYTRLILFVFITAILTSFLAVGAFATTRIRPGVGRAAEPSAPAESIGDTTFEGNIDTGNDGHIGENSGTGEFGDDTSAPASNSNDTTQKNPVESVVDDVSQGVNDAAQNVTDAVTGDSGMNIWGVVIAVVIVVAIAALIFALFSKKR